MGTLVAFLRAVNVGGRNKLPMAELRKTLHEAGFEDATTHIQTGNILVPHCKLSETKLEDRLEELLHDEFKLKVEVMVRTPAELAAVLKARPFPEEHLAVGFLKVSPPKEAERKFSPEDFQVIGREIYLLYPEGMGRTKMTTAWLEKALGTSLTARNWRVVSKLHELAQA